MKLKYQVTFKGESNQKYSVAGIIFEPNVSVYFDFNTIPQVILKDKMLKIEKVQIKEPGDDIIIPKNVIKVKGIKVIDSPKRYGVMYIGPESETSNIYIQGYFLRGVIRWDLTDKEIDVVKTLGKDFNIIEEEI
jgi:hypothetical protein